MITVIQIFFGKKKKRKAAKIIYNFLLASRLFYSCKCWDIRLLETSSKPRDKWTADRTVPVFVIPTVGSLNHDHLASAFQAPISMFGKCSLKPTMHPYGTMSKGRRLPAQGRYCGGQGANSHSTDTSTRCWEGGERGLNCMSDGHHFRRSGVTLEWRSEGQEWASNRKS